MVEKTGSAAAKRTGVYESVKNDILAGRLRYGERLNNEKWLCESLEVSRTTLRKAIDELISEGLLERRPNKGVYVSYSKFDTAAVDRPFSIFQELKGAGYTPTSKILYFNRRRAGEDLAKKFSIDSEDIVLEIHRIRYSDERPFMINHLFLPEKLFSDFNPWLLVDGSLHDILQMDYGVSIVKSSQNVTVATATKEQAELLGVHFRTALLKTSSTATSRDGIVVDYQESLINTNYVPYMFRFNWNGPSTSIALNR